MHARIPFIVLLVMLLIVNRLIHIKKVKRFPDFKSIRE
jgi:hypothetical protein